MIDDFGLPISTPGSDNNRGLQKGSLTSRITLLLRSDGDLGESINGRNQQRSNRRNAEQLSQHNPYIRLEAGEAPLREGDSHQTPGPSPTRGESPHRRRSDGRGWQGYRRCSDEEREDRIRDPAMSRTTHSPRREFTATPEERTARSRTTSESSIQRLT